MAPRIAAATVAEHREQQERAILLAARRLLASEGTAITLAGVAREAGLARTSLYQYYASLDALLDALVLDIFPQWTERVVSAMAAANDPGERVVAYVVANLELVAEGEHAVIRGLAMNAPRQLTEASKELHEQLRRPLDEALGGDTMAAELVQSWVFAGSRMIEDGRELAEVRETIERLLRPYCAGLG
ncbi:TetR/AcrR family transcriptional regulator [Nocardioides sp. Bht2]|uniref:TetR/AcrR family transcriptional regulator n=1 Tax=Nocardioides sp. Bht2 TaxID=3392297 RepID=UPI0039B386DB